MLRLRKQSAAASSRRRGSTALMAVVALLVLMLCMALVLDRLWMEAVSLELTVGAEAAALAAGRELASDTALKTDVDAHDRVESARQKAARIAFQNTVAGHPLELKLDDPSDVRFGIRLPDEDTGKPMFVETDYQVTTVRVRAERSRSRWNPVALVMHGIGTTEVADAVEEAEATIDNRLVGLRPYEGVAIPAFPLALLKHDPSGRRKETWQTQIEDGKGADRFGYDPEKNEVVEEPDGIREIVAKTMPRQGEPSQTNLLLADIGTRADIDEILAQIRNGIRTDHLQAFDGRLDFRNAPPTLEGEARLTDEVAAALREMIGQPRIVLLYMQHRSKGSEEPGTFLAVEPVAVRILSIRDTDDGSHEIVLQPTVLTTRTAIVEAEVETTNTDVAQEAGEEPTEPSATNRYIYKLQLTH